MSSIIGIGLAFVAMLSWGIGDFLIQKSTRKIGNTETLFIITLFGAIILIPFTWNKIIPTLVDSKSLILLLSGSVILLCAAILDFEALRIGKISIVEPLWSLEIPTSILLAYFILQEKLSLLHIILILILVIGLILVSVKNRISAKFLLERGSIIALVAAIIMGTANFFVGWGSRETDPLITNFFFNIFIALVTGIYLFFRNSVKQTLHDTKKHAGLLLPMCITDNVAWVAFATAMTLAPIGITVALSESYIIVAVILGIVINKEHLNLHQKVGLVIALCAAIMLVFLSS